ncbi:hypothetical protein E2R65_13030 [Mucilaginibacter phyllosphaerae]|uniref:Uncharacterized protein n=1 Tax=Mucilaginibacter phyllosphaerae TaxID=1812349 RepID=A0A4Y8ADY8_9SPHI|nr:hypothetical protein E2R65_13030 [Mucilaginibacter phyllosphaerae]
MGKNRLIKLFKKRSKFFLNAIYENPFKGIGEPEPLKHNLY